MENKELNFTGKAYNGFALLFINLIVVPLLIGLPFLLGEAYLIPCIINAAVWGIWFFIMIAGFFSQEPGETRVMVFFGKYKGTFSETGFFWVNPFMDKKKLSLRARNLDGEPIKVNDKVGNPIMIGLVLVWKLKDTYKAMFEIDSQTLAQKTADGTTNVVGRMKAFEDFVRVQSDAALRQVAGHYAYDETGSETEELTLRSGGEEINNKLEQQLNERLDMAGIEVVEARINYLAYAPEIAAVMLRRQQAGAIISAREKIVEGAVSMVKMAIDKLEAEKVVDMDEKAKATMVSNLMVVLCSEESAQPVVNSGAAQ
jgi:regulator of protease activity HflC (stomatin/prohibitin superfamily)